MWNMEYKGNDKIDICSWIEPFLIVSSSDLKFILENNI